MSDINYRPYELTAEQLAIEAMDRAKKEGYINENAPYLPELMKSVILEGIELGIGLATLGCDEQEAPADMMGSYLQGYYDGKQDGEYHAND